MGPTDSCTTLYNPMTHGDCGSLYKIVQPHDPWRGCTVVQCCTTPSPMERVSRCTTLYNPITHGEGGSLYNVVQPHDPWGPYIVVQPHDPWGFVTIAAPMTHGKKVAEPCVHNESGCPDARTFFPALFPEDGQINPTVKDTELRLCSG